MTSKGWIEVATVMATFGLIAALSGCNAQKVADLEKRVIELERKLAEAKFSQVRIVDKAGKEHAVLGLREDGTPQLKVVDQQGSNRFLLRLHPDGTPVLVMWGKGAKASAYVSVPGEGPPQMMMFDKTGKQTLKLP